MEFVRMRIGILCRYVGFANANRVENCIHTPKPEYALDSKIACVLSHVPTFCDA